MEVLLILILWCWASYFIWRILEVCYGRKQRVEKKSLYQCSIDDFFETCQQLNDAEFNYNMASENDVEDALVRLLIARKNVDEKLIKIRRMKENGN